MDLTADLLGIADVSRRVLSHLYQLTNNWRQAPDQLHQLKNDISRLSNLLETVRQAGQLHTQLGHSAAAQALNQDVVLARYSLDSIQTTLQDIEGQDDSGLLPVPSGIAVLNADAPRRLRWMSRKEEISFAQSSLRMSCQQILCRLVILNM